MNPALIPFPLTARWASRSNLTPSELPEAEHEMADGSLHAADHVPESLISVMLFPGPVSLCQPRVSSALVRAETSEGNMIGQRRRGALKLGKDCNLHGFLWQCHSFLLIFSSHTAASLSWD